MADIYSFIKPDDTDAQVIAGLRERVEQRDAEIERLRQTTTDALASLAEEVARARPVIEAAQFTVAAHYANCPCTLCRALRAYDER